MIRILRIRNCSLPLEEIYLEGIPPLQAAKQRVFEMLVSVKKK